MINVYYIRMNLESLSSNEEKLSFLLKTKTEIRKIIRCFEKPKVMNIRHYVRDDIFLDDNCKELKSFLKRVIMRYTLDPRDRRFPGEDILKAEMKKEIRKYEHLDEIIDVEINFLKVEKGRKHIPRKTH
jgi:hypothetical protein